jgi:N-carbamoyl-L-amino-acid hydrolase
VDTSPSDVAPVTDNSAWTGVRPDRVLDDLSELARLTADERGAQRVAFTETWAKARSLLGARLDELRVVHETDEAGNLWATLPGACEDAVVIGGHLDSVPNGGWLDGALNVFAGVEVLRRLAATPDRPCTVRLVDWADEEGVRFGGRSTFGSGIATGAFDPALMGGLVDRDGITLFDAAARFGIDLTTAAHSARQLRTMRAYVELHIEQGPVLEDLGLALAVVTGTIGLERHTVRFSGQAAHAGATLMDRRRDAFLAGARVALDVRDIAISAGGFGTCGSVTLVPGVATAVPGQCEMTIDLRHENQAVLEQMIERVHASIARVAAEERVTVDIEPAMQVPATPFHPQLIGIAREIVRALCNRAHEMPSATLHDATRVAQNGTPTVMVFVQSLGGVSHTKEEDTRSEDLKLAVVALDAVVERTIEWVAGQTRSVTRGRFGDR